MFAVTLSVSNGKAGEVMPIIEPEAILEARNMDLLTYLRNYEPSELVHLSGNSYCTRTHDSLKISNGKWMWWSRGIGGYTALDYLIKVKGMGFVEAVETIIGRSAILPPVALKKQVKDEPKELLLPEKSKSNYQVLRYLCGRGIDKEIVMRCLSEGLIYESLPYHNAVFVGFDKENKARYAAYRATSKQRFMGDCSGSDKHYSFRLSDAGAEDVHLFECAIDLLSYATIVKRNGFDYRHMNLVSLAGVYAPQKDMEQSKVPVALSEYLKDNPQTKRIVLHFDNDKVGRLASKALLTVIPKQFQVVDEPPPQGKDFNDYLLQTQHPTKKERSDLRL